MMSTPMPCSARNSSSIDPRAPWLSLPGGIPMRGSPSLQASVSENSASRRRPPDKFPLDRLITFSARRTLTPFVVYTHTYAAFVRRRILSHWSLRSSFALGAQCDPRLA